MQRSVPRTFEGILAWLAQVTLWRFRPGIVGLTGSVGKTTAKAALEAVLGGERLIRSSCDNIPSHAALLLAILGDWDAEARRLFDPTTGASSFATTLLWTRVALRGVYNVVRLPKSRYPEVLILEYVAHEPGALKTLLGVVRPNVAVITATGDIPVRVGVFGAGEEALREHVRLIEQLPAAGFAILNGDDAAIIKMKHRTRSHVMTFGTGTGVHLRLTSVEQKIDQGVASIAFKLEYGGSTVPVRLQGALGAGQVYAAAAAASAGLIFGMNLVAIAERLSSYIPAAGVLRLVRGMKDTVIIDDAYDAHVLSVDASLQTLADLPAKRRIVVLGDLIDLGRYAVEAHERLGTHAARSATIFVTVGSRAKLAGAAALRAKLPKRNVYAFDRAEDAVAPVRDLLKKGDAILVAGATVMRMGLIVDALREPTPADVVRTRIAI